MSDIFCDQKLQNIETLNIWFIWHCKKGKASEAVTGGILKKSLLKNFAIFTGMYVCMYG